MNGNCNRNHKTSQHSSRMCTARLSGPGSGEQGHDVTSCLVPCSFVGVGGLIPGVGGLAPSGYGPTPSCGQNDTRL